MTTPTHDNDNLQFVESAIANGATFASAGNGQYAVDYRKFEADHEAAARHLAAGGDVEADNGYSDPESGEYIDGDYLSPKNMKGEGDLLLYLRKNYPLSKFELIKL